MRTCFHLSSSRWVKAALLGAAMVAGVARGQNLQTVIATDLLEPYGVAVDPQNNYFITDSANNRIVRFNPDTGAFTNFAGFPGPIGDWQDGRGSFARFYCPQGIAMVSARTGMVVADSGNHVLRLVSFDGLVTTLAGSVGAFGRRDGVGTNARFYAPAGLAADTNGNVYVADLQNNAIRKLSVSNEVTTIASNLFRPSAVALGPDGRVWVADSGHHSIRVIETNGALALVAGSGSRALFGLRDSPVATNALFENPRGLFWGGGSLGWLVGDSGNHLLRRVFYNTSLQTYSVETFAATEGAGLNDPVGMARDLGGSLLIVDLGNYQLRRLSSSETVQPPVNNPLIGYITLTNNDVQVGTRLFAVTNATFYNDMVIGILPETGTQTFFTLGASDSPDGVPDPTPSSPVPPFYEDGMTVLPRSLLDPVQPDVTIKAISTQSERRPSTVITARFRFQVANPIIYGLNPTAFSLETATEEAELWYSVDNSDPAVNGPASQLYRRGTRLNIINGTNDVVFKVRGFKPGYRASEIIRQTFSFTNVPTSAVGFARDFRAGIGATVVLPVEVNLGANSGLQSLQFRVEVRPGPGAPALEAPLRWLATSVRDFVPLAPVAGAPTYLEAYQRGAVSGLAVAYLGTNAAFHMEQSGPVACLAVTLPNHAAVGQRYTLAVLEPSGTPDGLQTPLALTPLFDHALLVTNVAYLVGDTAVANWYQAGDFGDGELSNNDANNAFYASLGVRVPYPFTDAFDAMDAFPVDSVSSVGGDGQIRYLDWQTIVQRSLRLRNDNWMRARQAGGTRRAWSVRLPGAPQQPGSPVLATTDQPHLWWERQVKLSAETIEYAGAGETARVAVQVAIVPGANLAGLQFWPVVSLQRDAHSSDVPYRFEVNPDLGLPAPSLNSVPGFSTNNVIYVWDSRSFDPPLVGTNLLGWLLVQVPPSAQRPDAYTVRFANADGAPVEEVLYGFETVPGTLWVEGPAQRAPERISDEWKLTFFGSLTMARAQAGADPDNDGLSNLGEYWLGSHPLRPDWRVAADWVAGRPTLRWYSEVGKHYQVVSALAGPGPVWQALGGPWMGADRFLEFTDTNRLERVRFYRVEILP